MAREKPKGQNEMSYDYTKQTYETVFKPLIEDKDGQIDLLTVKKLLAGYYEYTEAIRKNSPADILNAIKLDYRV